MSVFLCECVNVCALTILCMRVCDVSLNDTVLGFRDFFCVYWGGHGLWNYVKCEERRKMGGGGGPTASTEFSQGTFFL